MFKVGDLVLFKRRSGFKNDARFLGPGNLTNGRVYRILEVNTSGSYTLDAEHITEYALPEEMTKVNVKTYIKLCS